MLIMVMWVQVLVKYLYIKKMGVFDGNPKVLKLNLETKKISTLI